MKRILSIQLLFTKKSPSLLKLLSHMRNLFQILDNILHYHDTNSSAAIFYSLQHTKTEVDYKNILDVIEK